MSRFTKLAAVAAIGATLIVLSGCSQAQQSSATSSGVTMTMTNLGQRDFGLDQASNVAYSKPCLFKIEISNSGKSAVEVSTILDITTGGPQKAGLGDSVVRVVTKAGDPTQDLGGALHSARAFGTLQPGHTVTAGEVLSCDLKSSDKVTATLKLYDPATYAQNGAVTVPLFR